MDRPAPSSAASSTGGDRPDILARINRREVEIERILAEARDAAASAVREARQQAAAVAAAQREEGAAEAERVREELLGAARREAERILAAGNREAAALRATPRERIANAGEALLGLLLPATGPARSAP